jgi:uncharacterized membrane protein
MVPAIVVLVDHGEAHDLIARRVDRLVTAATQETDVAQDELRHRATRLCDDARMNRAVKAWIIALVFVCGSSRVWAQSTGGSFGGGSFGGGSSGGSSSSSSGSSSSSSGGGSWGGGSSGSSYSGGGGGGSIDATGFLYMLCLGVAVLGVLFVMQRARRPSSPRRAASIGSRLHTSELALGLDWRARPELQEALARMAASGDTATAEGRAQLLNETALALRRAELSWLYVGYQELGWRVPSDAKTAFRNAAADARARFTRELVRNAGGHVTTGSAPPGLTARSDEGPGLIVVTVITAARRLLGEIDDPRSADSIRAALDDRCAVVASELAAFEVVWSPAAEEDRMSSAELEQHYPDLALIDPASIAGRVFCSYCNGPFPMELLKCPHCGAPVEDRPPPTGPGSGPRRAA